MLPVHLSVAVLLTRRMNGHLATALWNVISLHEAGQRVWLHDDGGGRDDDDVTHKFDDITYFRPEFLFLTGMKMSFASST